MRYLFTDELWAAFGPVAEKAKRYKCGQPPALPERAFFEALLYLARTGIPWRDLPAEFGRWDAVYNRFHRWVASGSLRRLFELLTADPAFGEVRRVLIDSTIVRATPTPPARGEKKSASGRSARRRSRAWAAAGAG
jgi:transposase